jgi:saccharopine dehydrogenase-like NADP-dependent oxidoreductase
MSPRRWELPINLERHRPVLSRWGERICRKVPRGHVRPPPRSTQASSGATLTAGPGDPVDVVVLGGGGLTGRCAVRDLAEHRLFDHVRVADLDPGLAEQAARNAGGAPRVTVETVDVRDPGSLRRVLDGARVCVNAVQYTLNLDVMRGCLAAGVEYLDFGGLFHTTRKQLALHEEFARAGLLAIPGLGQVPGVSNVFTALATEDMAEVESVTVRDGWVDRTQGAPPIVFTWSPSTFLDEMTLPAVIWDGGRYVEVPALSGAEEYEFPAPVGRLRLFRTLHSEPATIPTFLASKGLQHCSWHEGGAGLDVLLTLARLGLGSQEPVPVHGQPVVPRELLLAVLRREHLLGYPEGVRVDDVEITDVEVRGRTREGFVTRHALAVFRARPDWGLAATEYAVGICGAIGAEMIARGETRGKGVVPPEQSVPAVAFRAALERRGVATRLTPPEPPL